MAEFIIKTSEGLSRTGILKFPVKKIEIKTPSLLIYTRRGSAIHLTPDLIDSLHPDAVGFQFSTAQLVEAPNHACIMESGQSLASFFGLCNKVLVAITRDSLNFDGSESANTSLGATFATPNGRRHVNVEHYMRIVNGVGPDLFSSLCDEVHCNVTKKRNKISNARTLKWLDECIHHQKNKDENNNYINNNNNNNNLLASIVGGKDIDERIFSSTQSSLRNVFGFHLCGFGLGDNMEERDKIFLSIIENLPNHKIRHINGMVYPKEILQCVSYGIDLFECTFPHNLTTKGHAMIFPIRPQVQTFYKNGPNCEQNYQNVQTLNDLYINIRSTQYRTNSLPILSGCHCYTCTNHSLSYLHHLFNAKEMLGEVLLSIHNTHHYFNFFEAIREAIDGNEFEKYKTWFLSFPHHDLSLLNSDHDDNDDEKQ